MNQFSTLERLKLSQRIQDLHHKIDRGHYTNEDLAKLEYYEYLYKGSNRATTLDTKDPGVLYSASHNDYIAEYTPLFERVSFTNIDSQLRPYINRRLPQLNKFNNTLRKNQSFLERFKSKPIQEDALIKQQILKNAQKPFSITPSAGIGPYSTKPQVFLDIETDDTRRPIAITAVKTRFNNATNKFEVIDALQRYYKTTDARLKTTELIHKYTSDTLLQLRQQQGAKYSSTYGISERGILRKWIGNATVSGHNIMEFDLPVLFPRNQIRDMDVIDTVDIARSIYGTVRGPNDLDSLLKKLTGKNMAAWGLSHHDQNADVKASMLIAQALVRSNTSYAHDIKVVMNTSGLSIAPFEGGQGFGTSIIKGDPTKVGPEYDRTNYLTLEERMTLEKNILRKGGNMDRDKFKEFFAKKFGLKNRVHIGESENDIGFTFGEDAERKNKIQAYLAENGWNLISDYDRETPLVAANPKAGTVREHGVIYQKGPNKIHFEIEHDKIPVGKDSWKDFKLPKIEPRIKPGLPQAESINDAIQQISGAYYDDQGNEVPADNPGVSLEDVMSDLVGDAAEKLRTQAEITPQGINDSLSSSLTNTVERISQTNEQLATTINQFAGLNRDRWVKAFSKLGDDANDSMKSDLARALGIPGEHTISQIWRGSRILNAQNKFSKSFSNLRSLVRAGYGGLGVVQDIKNTLSMQPEWGAQESLDIQNDYDIASQKYAFDEAKREAKINEREEMRRKALVIATEQHELDRDASKHYGLYKDYKKGKIKSEDYAYMVNTGAIHSDDAIANLYKKIDEGAESTKRWTNAINAFKQSVGGVYDFKRWIDAGHEQSKGVLGALKGLVPSEVLGVGARFNEAFFGAHYADYYGKRKVIEPITKIGNAAIAAGFALAPVTGGASLIASGIGAGISGITQAVGTYGENKIKEKGQMLQSTINLLGGTMDTILLPFRVLGKVLRTVIKSFLALSGLIGGITIKGLRNMMDMGNPLTSYTGMNYTGYRASVAGDYGALLRKGSLESLRNTFTTDARGLYTVGKLNTNKIVAASMLGVFGDLYNPTSGGDPVASIANKAYKNMKGASANEKSRIMYLLGEIGGSELQNLVQSMNTLNMSYEDITNPAKRGVTWTNRNDENLRKRFQLDQYEFQSIGENIKWNGMRIADKLWVKIGKPVYNGLNDIIELIADNNWQGVFDKLKDFWKQIKNWWNNDKDIQDIKNIFNKPIQGFIDGIINGFQAIGTEILKITQKVMHSVWDIVYPFISNLADIDILATLSPFNKDGIQFKSKTPTEKEINDEVKKLEARQKGLWKNTIVESDPIYKKIYQTSGGTVDTRNLSEGELKKLAAARLVADKGSNVGSMIIALRKTGLFSEEELQKYFAYDPLYGGVHNNIDNTFALNNEVLKDTTEFLKGSTNNLIITLTDGVRTFGKIVTDASGRIIEATGLGTEQKIGNALVKVEKGE